jgi:tetratricopeptide (TPR) repeat protein
MEAWAKIVAGVGLLCVSLGYLYRPALVLRMNSLCRSMFFNDSYVLHYRRRWGLLFFIFAVLFFYSGFINLARKVPVGKSASYLDLSDAYKTFRAHQYRATVVRCEEILKRESDNVHAWLLLGEAWTALGRKDLAKNAWDRVLKLDPDNPVGRGKLFKTDEQRGKDENGPAAG